MSLGVMGRKCGMTRVFTEDGSAVPVTVIEVLPNRVAQVRTPERDGYRAVQAAIGERRAVRLSKPLAGHLGKAGVGTARRLREFRLADHEGSDLAAGSEIHVDLFKAGQKVDVSGTTIGKGFSGVIRRHHFSSQDATHGNSLSHRAPGSIGQRQTPGRVFPGKRMAGHLGNCRRTVLSLEVVRVDTERNLLLVKGAIPGPAGGDVVVRPSARAR